MVRRLFDSTISRRKQASKTVFHAAKEIFPMSTSPMSAPYVEPWLRGTHTDVPAVGRAVLHALDLALDDLTKWTEGLTDAEVHSQPLGLPTVAFHLRHIARSTDRLLSYAEGNQLSSEQLAALNFIPRGRIFLPVWMSPLAQRACWVLKAVISIGNSAGHSTSCRYLNFHPANCTR